MATQVAVFSVCTLSPWERAGVRASSRTDPVGPCKRSAAGHFPYDAFNKLRAVG